MQMLGSVDLNGRRWQFNEEIYFPDFLDFKHDGRFCLCPALGLLIDELLLAEFPRLGDNSEGSRGIVVSSDRKQQTLSVT